MMTRRRRLERGRGAIRKRTRAARILVVAGGRVTEKGYFEFLGRELGVTMDVRPMGLDPLSLAKHAKTLLESEHRASKASGGDDFKAAFVVTDVDNFSSEQLKAAEAICRKAGISLVVSNPCFEVWLIDHVESCPDSICTPRAAQERAMNLGLVTGRKNKDVVVPAVTGKLKKAISNAAKHDTPERMAKRKRLDTTDFAPWTDMPSAVRMLL